METRTRSSNLRLFLIAGLLVALGLAIFVSGFASSAPDGLERVAQDKGFLDSARDHLFGGSPLADYGVEGVKNERLATALSGLVGVLITFGIGLGLFALLRVLRGRDPGRPGGPGGPDLGDRAGHGGRPGPSGAPGRLSQDHRS